MPAFNIRAGLLLSAVAGGLLAGVTAADTQAPPAGAWVSLQQRFYDGQDIGVADDAFMTLQAPATTPDAAATPLTVRFGPTAVGRIKRLRLIIDNNPSPLAATLRFAVNARITALEFRVRVDRYTSVRAVAETDDGAVVMSSSWVNASGGCSAPPHPAGPGRLGEVRLRASPDAQSIQVSLRHPNHSGFQIDPLSGDAVPPWFVTALRLSSQGQTLIEADTGISISENPTLGLASDRALPAPLDVEFVDSTQARYHGVWRPAAH